MFVNNEVFIHKIIVDKFFVICFLNDIFCINSPCICDFRCCGRGNRDITNYFQVCNNISRNYNRNSMCRKALEEPIPLGFSFFKFSEVYVSVPRQVFYRDQLSQLSAQAALVACCNIMSDNLTLRTKFRKSFILNF